MAIFDDSSEQSNPFLAVGIYISAAQCSLRVFIESEVRYELQEAVAACGDVAGILRARARTRDIPAAAFFDRCLVVFPSAAALGVSL